MTEAQCILNGHRVTLRGPDRETTLLDALRASGLTGAKEGCAEGECGACTVMFVGTSLGETSFRAVNSCLMLLPMAAGHDIYTVESLAEQGQLCEAQRAMAAAGGSQCGYCTPGFVMSLVAEQHRPGRVGACDTMAMAGNLCRCTGYRPIAEAAMSLGAAPPGRLTDRLREAAPVLTAISGDTFSRPLTVDQCVALLLSRPNARIVAGATDVGVESNLKGQLAPHLVSVEAIDELRTFTRTPDIIRIGAALTLTEIGEAWTDAPGAVLEWLALFASPPIRNRATLGGNLATASPIGDAAPLFLALDANVEIAGPAGRRAVPLYSFFTGYRQTALSRGEMLTSIDVPLPLPRTVRFYKMAKRRLDDISTVAAAMALDSDASGRVSRARFGFGGVAATPVRVMEAEAEVEGRIWDEAAAQRVREIIGATLTPIGDHRGSKEFRLAVSKSLVDKFHWESTR